MQRLFLSLSFALALPASATAQGPMQDSAAVVARVVLWALAHSDFRYVARHADPSELHRLRMDFDSLLRADSASYIAVRLFRMDSTAQVRRLDDVEFASGLMAFAFGANPSFRPLATIVDIDIPGLVYRGRDTAFVVYRWVYPRDSVQTTNYNVERMVRCGGAWCLQSPGNFSGLLRLLKEPMVPVRQQRPPAP